MNSFTPGQLIVSKYRSGICHLVIDAEPMDGGWWVTVLSVGADKPLGPIILSPALWKAVNTDELLHPRTTHPQ